MEKYIIFTNKIRCKKCGDIIESTWVHDFKQCKCGAVAVDGGHVYMKRLGNVEDWEELSEWELKNKNKEMNVDKVFDRIFGRQEKFAKQHIGWDDIVKEYCKIPFDMLVDLYCENDGNRDTFSCIDYEGFTDFYEYTSKEVPFHNFLICLYRHLRNVFDTYETLRNPSSFCDYDVIYPIDDVYALQSYEEYKDDMYRFIKDNWDKIVNGEMIDPISEYKLSINTNPFAWMYNTKLVNLSLDEEGKIKPIKKFLDKVYEDSYLKLLEDMEKVINKYRGKIVIAISGDKVYTGRFETCKVAPNWELTLVDWDGCRVTIDDEFAHYFIFRK